MNSKILYVEDDPTLGFVTTDNLREEGYEVLLEKDGKSALKRFKKEIVDICILDVMLPEMDGMKVMEFLTSHENYKDITVIVNSSLEKDDERLIKLRKMGAIATINKSDAANQKNLLLEYLKKI